MDCIICYEKSEITCKSGQHSYCKNCIIKAMSICITEQKKLDCFECHTDFESIETILPDKLWSDYQNVLLEISLKELSITLHACPFCENRVILDNLNNDSAFHCLNGCKRKSCIKCQKDYHDGFCQNQLDDLASRNFMIVCCKIPFIRGDACNKVACPRCKKLYCWLCKQNILSYDHFHSRHSICPLYGDKQKTIVRKQPVLQPQIRQPLVRREHYTFEYQLCGANTKKNTPCKNKILVAMRQNVRVQNNFCTHHRQR